MALLNPIMWAEQFPSLLCRKIYTPEHRNEFKSNNNNNKIEVYGVYQRCLLLGLYIGLCISTMPLDAKTFVLSIAQNVDSKLCSTK